MPKVALQLYSIKEIGEKDFYHSLQVAKQAGYEGVEFAGFFGKEAEETKKYLEDLDLLPAGTHIGLDALMDKFDDIMEYNAKIENSYVVVPFIPERFHSLDGLKTVAHYFNEMSEKAKQYGIKIGYHNHAYDFKQIEDHGYFYDIFASNTTSDIVLEIDTFWVVRGGADPVLYSQKYKDRLDLMHFKDISKDMVDTEVGSGLIDFPAILNASDKIKWCVMEQEKYTTLPMLESIAVSCEYIKKIIKDMNDRT